MISNKNSILLNILTEFHEKIETFMSTTDQESPSNFPQILLSRILVLKFLERSGFIPKMALQIQFTRNNYENFFQDHLLPKMILFSDGVKLPLNSKDENAFFFRSSLFKFSKFEKTLFMPDDIWLHAREKRTLFKLLEQFKWSLNEFEANNDVITPKILERFLEKSIRNKSRKKTDKTGSFYTPTIITDWICKKLLSDDILARYCSNENKLNIKILDPSMGSGAFLMNALRVLLEFYETHVAHSHAVSRQEFLLEVIQNNLYGMDIQDISVEIFKIRLILLLLHERCNKMPDLTNFHVGDALRKNNEIQRHEKTGKSLELACPEIIEAGGFDVLMANPPYLSSKEIHDIEKEYFRKSFKTARGQFDLYSLFLERGIELLKQKGHLGYIIPESFLIRSNFASIRKMVLDETNILEIHQVKGVFEDPKVANIILILQKSKHPASGEFIFTKSDSLLQLQQDSGKRLGIAQAFFQRTYKNSFPFLTRQEQELIMKLLNGNTQLSQVIEIHRGEELGKTAPLLKDAPEHPSDVPILSGNNVQPYIIRPPFKYVDKKSLQKKSLYFTPKIVLRQLGKKLQASIDEEGKMSTLQTIYNITLTNNRYSLKNILALLNSTLFNYLYLKLFQEKEIFPRILIEHVKMMPIFPPDSKLQSQITKQVDLLITKIRAGTPLDSEKCSNSRQALDKLIHECFGLDAEDINVIQDAVKNLKG
ncbi:MAG: Eco57I restriction-modification methylase domain-containing protein [Candidatus Helarchaeota archaeon]